MQVKLDQSNAVKQQWRAHCDSIAAKLKTASSSAASLQDTDVAEKLEEFAEQVSSHEFLPWAAEQHACHTITYYDHAWNLAQQDHTGRSSILCNA